jgi:hypothetical protein
MTFRRCGYFPRFAGMLGAHGIGVMDVVRGTGLTEKSVRRMANNSGYSLFTSVEKVVAFLNGRNLMLKAGQEFAEAEG